MREPAVEIEVPDKAVDPIAAIVSQRWNSAVFWRSQETVGNKSLSTLLNDCYDQREGILAPCDREIVEALGVDLYVNISGLKTSALVAWMRDLLINTSELPFTLSPTPVPELSDESRLRVLNQVKRELFGMGFDGDLLQLIREIKFRQRQAEMNEANHAADAMYTLIKDQCLQGGFRRAMLKMVNDFAVYPFAGMHGPIPTMVTQMEWSGSSLRPKNSVQFQFRPLSVFDVYWTPDSRDAQSGTAVMVRERVTKQELYKCLKMKSYIKDNVIKVLEGCVSGRIDGRWMSRNREQPDTFTWGWGNGETVEVLRHYGLLSGKELMKYGITGLDANDYYESTVSVIGPYTIQVFINPNPSINIRPVYLSSFEQTGERIPGISICQKVRDVERAYLATLRFMMVNMGFAAGPIGEVDYSRIQRYMTPEDVGQLAALTMYPVDADMSAGGRPAHYFHNVPANVGAFMNVGQFFMDLADRVTQIPASIHGEPVGTGANRTFRGMAMLYGNAIKPIQSAIANLDELVFSPLGNLMYNYNMRYWQDESVKGDAKILAQGSTGLIQKEVAKQTALDTLQLVATAGSAAQGMVNPRAVQWAVDTALRAAGVPAEVLEGGMPAPAVESGQVPQQQLAAVPQQGLEGQQ